MAVNHGPSLIASLINYQCEIRQRTLRVPCIFNNLSALLALYFPTMKARIAAAKLSYLLKVVSSDQDILFQCVFSTTVTATNIIIFPLFKNASDWRKSGKQPSPP